MTSLKWIFDPLPPSGAIQGGIPIAHVLGPDMGIDTFVREVLQNSLDQATGNEIVRVNFGFHEMDGAEKKQFADAIELNQLERHLEGAAGGPGVMGSRLEQTLERLASEPLILLRIDDSGTQGLTGGENEGGKNFNALCRNVLDTAEDRPLRGGSFGLGKAVLWRCSSISTVLFSSQIAAEDPRSGFRLFGRVELPYHRTDDKGWNGPGWFGLSQDTAQGVRAVSVWDDQAAETARKANLFRPAQLDTGTTIGLVGFYEPWEEEPRPILQVAEDIVASASRWFWPSIRTDQQALQVAVEVFQTGEQVYNRMVELEPDVSPFMIALTGQDTVPQVSQPGDVAERHLHLKIPARKPSNQDPGTPEVDGEFRLRLRFASGEESPGLQNRVALMRGAGMVIEYKRPARSPAEAIPYHAVLSGGLANGNSDTDHTMERFLRAAEPPSHNQWMPGTDRLQAEYRRGARARFQRLWADLDRAVVELCEEQAPATDRGPRRLARLFPIRAGSGEPSGRPQFRTDRLDAHLEGSTWVVSGHILKRGGQDWNWAFNVSLWLDAETGRGEQIKLVTLEADTDHIVQSGDAWEVKVPSSVRSVSFKGQSQAAPLGDEALHRTRVRLDVRPRRDIVV